MKLNDDSQTKEALALSDLYCAAALAAAGFIVLSLERSDSRRVDFIFERTDASHAAASNYWSGELLVSARAYSESIKALKSRLYNE